ncbi:uncharacterized protein LOC132311777 isoform X2 [Cornus florida]|nr:uncharacterized protein LOC132311777 isoform X2 [Cornus florida]XP_059665858.1 uncharacterized protein LOC132311777 isoform X2 [Cornus florida]
MSDQGMPHNTGMNDFPGRTDSFSAKQEHPYISSKTEGQWQQDRDAPKGSNPMMSHMYNEGQRGNATRPFHQGQMLDAKVELEIQGNKEPRLQSHEQDMEIGYEDKPLPLTFENLEQKFQGEVMKLMKEQWDAEDAENARHREKIIEINTRYQEKLSSLRAKQANRGEEFLHKELQARRHQYQQAEMDHHLTNTAPRDPYGYGGAAAAEAQAHRAYSADRFEPYREQTQFLGAGISQGTEGRVPYPHGRVYNNAGARYR